MFEKLASEELFPQVAGSVDADEQQFPWQRLWREALMDWVTRMMREDRESLLRGVHLIDAEGDETAAGSDDST